MSSTTDSDSTWPGSPLDDIHEAAELYYTPLSWEQASMQLK